MVCHEMLNKITQLLAANKNTYLHVSLTQEDPTCCRATKPMHHS